MTDTWLTLEEVARVEDVSIECVRKRIDRGQYTASVIDRDGRSERMVHSLTLTHDARAMLRGEPSPLAQRHSQFSRLTAEEHAMLWRRISSLKAVLRHPERTTERADAIRAIATAEDVDTRTIRRWLAIITNNEDWSIIVRRNVQPRGPRKVHGLLQQLLESEYLRTRNKKLAYEAMLRSAGELAIEPPSERTASRVLLQLDNKANGVVICGQRKKEFYDKADLFILRDWSTVRPLQVIVGDYKRMDIVVEWFDGTLFYPWCSFWRDGGTRMLFPPSVSDRPNARGVAGSLRLVMKGYGIPEGLYIDNGKEYKARFLKNAEFAEEVVRNVDLPDDAYNLLTRLNHGADHDFMGNVVHAIPRNARAKPVERAFGIGGVDQFTRNLKGWTGASWREMPDHTREMMRLYNKRKPVEIPAEYRAMHITEFYALLVDWLYRINSTPSRAHDMAGLSPNQAWKRWLDSGWRPSHVADDRELGLLLMQSKQATVRRGGLIQFRNEYYTSDELKRLTVRRGQTVPAIIRWDDMDCIGYNLRGDRRFAARELYVYSAERTDAGSFIGVAEHYLGIPAFAGNNNFTEAIRHNRMLNGEVKAEAREIADIGRQIMQLSEGESLNAITMTKETVQLSRNRQRLAEIGSERDALARLREQKATRINNEDLI